MDQLPDLRAWGSGTKPELAEREVRRLENLIGDADNAINAERRIIVHDGPLQSHLLSLAALEASQKQLISQLAAIMEKRDTEVVDFALDGPRYTAHRASAKALSLFLSAMQQLYLRVGQAVGSSRITPRVPLEISSLCQLEVAGFFPSSFGIRFAAPTRADYGGYSLAATTLETTFELVNSPNPLEHAGKVGHWGMSKYRQLVKTLIEAEATPKVRWRTPNGSDRQWITDTGHLLTLANRLTHIRDLAPKTIEDSGTLIGASLRRRKFEFEGSHGVISGTAPHELADKVTQHFGKHCRIVFVETTYVDDTTEQEKRTRTLIDVTET
ncbi:MAG: hypothetical protein WCV99_19255 [Sterolibacterium sp.]|jgi:hypothetical protein